MKIYKILYLMIIILVISCVTTKKIDNNYKNEENDSTILAKKVEILSETKINQFDTTNSIEISPYIYEPNKNPIKDSNAIKIVNSFNSKVYSPDNKYFVAYFEGETSSKYIGFFDENGEIISYTEINIEPIANFSTNGNYLVVFSLFSNQFFCFDRNGKQILKSSYEEILDHKLTFYNVFIDNSGNYLLLNGSYLISLFKIKQRKVLWEKKIENRRVISAEFDSKLGIIYSCSLLNLEDWSEEDKYTIDIFSMADGENLGRINKVSKMNIINGNVIVKSQNSWYEYEIK